MYCRRMMIGKPPSFPMNLPSRCQRHSPSLIRGRTSRSSQKSSKATVLAECETRRHRFRKRSWITVYYIADMMCGLLTTFIFCLYLVTGVVRPGEFLAIMGASGAGKTTLLNCLTFRNTETLQIHGQRFLNGAVVNTDTLARISGYVQQDDLFIPTLTVKEHLQFQVPNALSFASAKFIYLTVVY